jgi:hypothetical protein
MTVARITEIDRKPTQSGKANNGRWQLEFERVDALRPDPLTGWAGSSDTRPQVRLTFDTRDAAVDYARRNGFDYHIVPASPVSLKIQAYADNFR